MAFYIGIAYFFDSDTLSCEHAVFRKFFAFARAGNQNAPDITLDFIHGAIYSSTDICISVKI